VCRQHGNHEVLLPFLEVKSQGRDQTCLEDWVEQVRSWYADATAETRKEYEQGTKTAMLRTAASVVAKYMREKKLSDWVEVQNDELGIAPAPTLVVNQLQDFGLEGVPAVGPRRVHKHSLQFLSRWRKRWKVGLTKNRPMDACTPEEVKDKVGSQAVRKPHWIQQFFKHVIRTCKKKGPLYGPCFGAVCTVFSYMGVKKRHPFLNGFRGFVRFPQGQVGLAVEQFLASDCPAGQDSVGLQS